MDKKLALIGTLLIAVGVLQILNHTGVIAVGWNGIAWLCLAALGLWMIIKGFSAAGKAGGGIFWGTLFVIAGCVNFGERAGLFSLPGYLDMPMLFLAVGIAFLVVFIHKPQDWHVIVLSTVFTALGTLMLLAELDFISQWVVRDAIAQYWPVGLIVFGLALLLNKRTA
jgi:hypothetical protein